jgi:hypothetical protein
VRIAFGARPPQRAPHARLGPRLDPRILPDMGVKVTFLREADGHATDAARPLLLVPKAAVTSEGGASYAYVVREQTVERRAIQTAGADGDRVEVAAGLAAGERVVLSPPPGLRDGHPIVVRSGS